MPQSLLNEISSMCDGTLLFCEVLEDILFDNKVSKGIFAARMGWKPQVVSRLMEGQIPNWLALDVVQRMGQCAECLPSQNVQLVNAFICDLLRKRKVVARG